MDTPLSTSHVIVQICLFLVSAIAIFGGSLQMYLGQPDTSPRLDNVHRFMAGVYLSTLPSRRLKAWVETPDRRTARA